MLQHASPLIRFRLWPIALLVVVLAGSPIAWYLASPLFVNRTVNEAATGAGLQVLSRGEFGAIDSIHKGEGTASLYRAADGRYLLGLDSFRVTNGPDLYVYVSTQPAPTDAGQLHQGEPVEVARLKGNVGTQNYELPAGVDPARIRSVVIYCKQFSVVFSTATLTESPTS